MSGWSRFIQILNRFERAVLVLLLFLMIILAFLPILFRNLLAVGLLWIDPLLRHLVLWVALLGASLATREGRHIKIDLVAPHLSPGKRAWLEGGLDLLSGVVCLVLVWPALEFIRMEYEMGKFLIWKIPLWASQAVMPFMLTVIGCRFLFSAGRRFPRRNRSESWESLPPS